MKDKQMKIEGRKEEGREQRDLLTVVKCMLCLIPDGALTIREELEDMLPKLSFPTPDELVYLNKELSLILYDHYEKYKKYTWMKIVLAVYMNKNISEVLGNFGEKADDAVDIEVVKALCDNGILKASVELEDELNEVHIKLKDINKDNTVILESIPMREE